MNSLPNILRHILKPSRSHLDLVWMPSSRGDQPCTYPFLLRAAPRSFLFFHIFFHTLLKILCLQANVSSNVSFLTFFYIFLCLQADVPSNEIPPHRSRPQGELKHRLWHLLTPSSRPSSYLQDMFLTPFLLLFLLFLFTGQVHSPTWHRCLWRLSLQVPQQVINSHQQGVPEKSW